MCPVRSVLLRDETLALELAVVQALRVATGGGGDVEGEAPAAAAAAPPLPQRDPNSALLTTATRPYVVNNRHGISQPIVIDPNSITRLIHEAAAATHKNNTSSSSSSAAAAAAASSSAQQSPPSGRGAAALGKQAF